MPLSRRAFLHLSGAAAFDSLWSRSAFRAASDDASLCRKLASDPLRPQYHLLPSHNWMNDPNGPIYFAGRYHMFHQYNPGGATWGNMHWAHATSPDMIHWQHEPIALAPTPGGPDSDGAFSGSAVVDQGKVTSIYTGVAPSASAGDATLRDGVHTWRETQCLAVAQDNNLRIWKKLPGPVIAAPPPGLEVTGFRDPALWRQHDKWMLILGSGIRGKGGMILLYTSPDLRHWTYLHPLIEGAASKMTSVNPVDTGEMWECPDFFPLGDKHVLLISTEGKVRWKVGTYSNQRFTPENEGVVDWGSYYAAKTMLDAKGRRILWGWIREARPDADLIAAGWAGAMSLPRVLTLNSQNELQATIVDEIKTLRTEQGGMLKDANTSSNYQHALNAFLVHDLAAEIEMQIQTGTGDCTLRLYSDSGDFASISCQNQKGSRVFRVNGLSAPFPGPPASPLRLHLFVDGSVLEVFANETFALTARVYQVPTGPLRLKLNSNAKPLSLNAWQLKTISADRLAGNCTVEG